jgi:predicted ATP-binding protein involved in virulence
MKNIFITDIHIKSVRHLKDLKIPLSSTERQHLVLTGRNGSGKTSVLLELKNALGSTNENELPSMSLHTQRLSLQLSDLQQVKLAFKNKTFILAFFPAKRLSEFKKPIGPQKLDFQATYKLEDKINPQFLQYLINLNYRKLNATVQKQFSEVQKIDDWFHNFTKSLKFIFGEEKLELVYDFDDFNFNIVLPNREKFDLNTLSDGYSAVMNILTELLLRMNHQRVQLYDIQGIVLIDEIEAHLHIDLQKKILPFLTSFFPKIQFIVTTHSPFVLTSVKNAVVYDLEKQEAIHDLTGYSVDAVIEGYFDADKYSEIIKQKVVKYEQLMSKKNLSDAETDDLDDLKQYFKQLPYFLAPELQFKIQQIQLSKLTQ